MRLEADEQQQILARLTPESAADVIEFIPDEPAGDLLGELSPQVAASIVSEMSSDEQADVLSELDAEELEDILSHMDDADVIEARQLMAYDDDVAGGLMMKEYFCYPKMYRASSVLNDLAGREEDYELNHVLYIYVSGRAGELLGVAGIRDIIVASSKARLVDILQPAMSEKTQPRLMNWKISSMTTTFQLFPWWMTVTGYWEWSGDGRFTMRSPSVLIPITSNPRVL